MSEHLSKQFDSELEAIRARLTRMGGLVEEQLRSALTAFADSGGTTDRIAQAIDYAIGAGAQILNMSFSGPADPVGPTEPVKVESSMYSSAATFVLLKPMSSVFPL